MSIEETIEELEPCPFCATKSPNEPGAGGLKVILDLIDGMEVWQVQCWNCGATGPEEQTRACARTGWNHRT